MKTTRNGRRLRLHRETVRVLDQGELAGVQGAAGYSPKSNAWTRQSLAYCQGDATYQ